MKKAAFISGTLFGSLAGLGSLFKIMHWPGANVMLVLGVALFSLVFVPTIAMVLYSKNAQ